MNAAIEIVAELHARGVRIEPRPHGGVRLVPARLIDRGLLGRILTHKAEVLAHLRAKGQELEIDRLAHADGWKPRPSAGAPAFSILETCQSYGVALSIDENGDLLVGKTGAKANEPSQPWPSLIMALEAHYDAVRDLVSSGWTLRAGFPKSTAA